MEVRDVAAASQMARGGGGLALRLEPRAALAQRLHEQRARVRRVAASQHCERLEALRLVHVALAALLELLAQGGRYNDLLKIQRQQFLQGEQKDASAIDGKKSKGPSS